MFSCSALLNSVFGTNEIGQGRDSSGTDSLHAASAGGHESTHHAPHPEPVDEHLGVCPHSNHVDSL